MRPTAHLSAPALAATLAALGISAPVSAAHAPITGRLSAPGYTVIGVAPDGRASTAFAGNGAFTLSPPAKSVSVHLRAPDGTYAGPVVVEESAAAVPRARAAVARAQARLAYTKRKVANARKRLRRADTKVEKRRWTRRLRRWRNRRDAARSALEGARTALERAQTEAARRPTRAILGIRAGAGAGTVVVGPGFAVARGLKGAANAKWVDASRRSRARNGVPLGAGNFGFVVSQPSPGTVPGDTDLDGVPNPLDVDDDGDLVLDNFERSGSARAAQQRLPSDILIYHHLSLALEDSVNANAAAITLADVDRALSTFGVLQLSYPTTGTTELDCRGLSYCSPGGTGVVAYAGPPGPTPATGSEFPECCDADGDGFGTMTTPPGLFAGDFFLSHGAGVAGIGTGDVVVQRVTAEGTETAYATTLQGVIATAPAATSWSDTAGHGQALTYPVPPPYVGSPDGPERTREAFVAAPGPDGDIILTFTFWRPQRQAMASETGDWTDIGQLLYTVTPENLPDEPGGPKFCPQSALSSSDPRLTAEQLPGFGSLELGDKGGGFRDAAVDAPTNPDNTLSMSVNVTDCLTAYGRTWDPGEEFWVSLYASNGFDRSSQGMSFRRE